MALPATASSIQCVANSTNSQSLTLPPTTTNKTLSVRGTIDLTKSTVALKPFMVLPGSKYTLRPVNSSFSITLLNSGGKILGHYPFDPKLPTTTTSQNEDRLALLSEAVPYDLCTKQIVISKDDKALASRSVDTYAPHIRVIFPNGGESLKERVTVIWQASDADGNDNLTYSVFYSDDKGRTWQTVAMDIKETHLTVNLETLPGGPNALFRIIATDGVNTGIGDSNSTFSVPSIGNAGG
jgi:hypothetical protein